MTQAVLVDTKLKLDHVAYRLSDEFRDISAADVQQDVAEVSRILLAHARFTDFVPLLTHRFVREHLVDEGHEHLLRAA
jgi:hypothetical protein